MMYNNYNLRKTVQDWKNRLYEASVDQFEHQLKYFINNIENNKQLFGLIQDSFKQYPYYENTLSEVYEEPQGFSSVTFSFANETQHASFSFLFLKYIVADLGHYGLNKEEFFLQGSFPKTQKIIIDALITPIVHYLSDKLEKSNSIIFLLEKYKKRTEWFTKEKLLNEYKTATKSYEQIFEDDLRMFLFDQGIDYPFSTPKSSSGRADIVGSIDTSDPIILEIKIVDKNKNYNKNRVKEGFRQIVEYVNDYHKDNGYLVIFNVDKPEINFQFKEESKIFPPMLTLNNKTYFFIIINLLTQESASKLGKVESIAICEADLMS